MKFSFISWNIRHFKGSTARLNDVDKFITELNPDIFGLMEYRGKSSILEFMVERFPEYDFAVTDSTGNLEVVVGFRRGKFDQVVWTQKRQFNDRRRVLRPGALISVRFASKFYNLLFLHSDSGTTETDYNNRQKVLKKVWSLKEALARRTSDSKANLIVLGDLNTMGKGRTISGASEIRKLEREAVRNGMKLVSKDRSTTWSQWGKGPRGNRRRLYMSELDGLMESDLDHVIASNELSLLPVGNNGEKVHVRGWHQRSGQAKADWLWDISDHCALYGEVQ